MTITNQNATIYRGDSAILPVTLTAEDGGPFDPAMATSIKYRLSRTWHSPEEEALVVKEFGNGISAITGGVQVELSKVDTNLEPGFYYHELKVQQNADRATMMVGTVIIKKALRMTPSNQVELLAAGITNDSPTTT